MLKILSKNILGPFIHSFNDKLERESMYVIIRYGTYPSQTVIFTVIYNKFGKKKLQLVTIIKEI